MKANFILIMLLCLTSLCCAQNVENTKSDISTFSFYKSLLTRLKKPETVNILYLNNSKLEVLPETIGKFSNITSLYLNDNKLFDLPHQLYYLQKLETLDLRNNSIGQLSPKIGNLKNLIKLDLRGNGVNCMPEQIKYLKSLKWLYLGPAEVFDEDEKVRIRKLLPRTIVFFEKTALPESPLADYETQLGYEESYLSPNNIISANKKIVTRNEPIKVYYQNQTACFKEQ